jgi:membrane protein
MHTGPVKRIVDALERLIALIKRPLDWKLVREINDDGLFDVAAGVAFWLVLSLPAAALAGLASVSLLGDDLTLELRTLVDDFLATVLADQSEPVRNAIDGVFDQRRPGVLSVSIAAAVFTLSRGFAGLVRGLDQVYDIEETRNFFHTRVLSIGLAIGTLLTVAGSTALWATAANAGVPVLVRLGLSLVVLVLWSATMFHVGPNHHTPWRYDLPGAAVAAVGWLVLSLGFGWYVQILGGDGSNDVIGAAGALLLALTWVWAACSVFLIGGEINEILASRHGVVQANRSVVTKVRDARSQRRATPSGDDSDG